MLSIRGDEVRHLQEPGGVEFTGFVDAVIRRHFARFGGVDADVDTSIRTNIPDGGVDTLVRGAVAADPTGWMACPTVWQYKGTDFTNVVAKRSELLTGAAVVERISRGDAFRLAVADSMPSAAKTTLETYLRDEAARILPGGPAPRVLGADDLAAWVNRYPALVLALFRHNFGDTIVHLDAWRRSMLRQTREYVEVDAWDDVHRSLERHVDLSRDVRAVIMPLHGDAGVGKTRLAYEVASSLPGAEAVVLYCIGDGPASRIATELANHDDTTAVIVADECSASGRQVLDALLRGCRNRVRVIAIDNMRDRAVGMEPEQQLERMSAQTLSELLDANFPEVPAERRRAYAEMSAGFPRLASDLCLHDDLIAPAGTVAPALPSIGEYLRSRLTVSQLEALAALSLVTKVGYEGDVAGEFADLCAWLNIDANQTTRALREVHDGPGFVARTERYYYVTPEIVAQIAHQLAWKTWVGDYHAFLGRVPEALVQQTLDRAWRSASEEVRRDCAEYFRRWAEATSPDQLRDAETVRRLVALADTQPDQYLATIRNLVEACPLDLLAEAHGDGLLDGSWGPRRSLVWMAERFAAFPEYFSTAERILLRLALAESEPSISNNATNIWRQFFRVFLSGTSVSFHDRLALLAKRITAPETETRKLAASALDGIFDYRGSRIVGPSVIAGRIPPPEWQPKTHADEQACYSSAVELLEKASSTDLREIAASTAIANSRVLIQRGFFRQLQIIVEAGPLTDEMVANLIENLDTAHDYDLGSNALRELRDAVKQWRHDVSHRDLHSRLLVTVGQESWSLRRTSIDGSGLAHAYADEIQSIAAALVASPDALKAELPWLLSHQAPSASDLGNVIGTLDAEGACFDLILDAVQKSEATMFARGYVRAYAERGAHLREEALAAIDGMEKDLPEVAMNLAFGVEENQRALARAKRLFAEGRLPAGYLAARNFVHEDDSEALSHALSAELLGLLVPAGERGDQRAFHVALSNLAMVVPHDFAASPPSSFLSDPALVRNAWIVVENVELRTSLIARWWESAVVALGRLDPSRSAHLAAKLLVDDSRDALDHAVRVLGALAAGAPGEVMQALGGALLDKRRGWTFQIRDVKELIGVLPAETVEAWLTKAGTDGARRIARSLPAPYISTDEMPIVPPLTAWVLRTFESDDRTFREFCFGVHNFEVYHGDIAAEHEEEARIARRFLDHPIRRIREWAAFEERTALREARDAKRRAEEQDLS